MKSPKTYLERRDANFARMDQFRNSIGKAKQEYLDSRYGNEQLFLLSLATHPDYQRRGAAAKLCAWGVKEAEKRAVNMTLFSSPMGRSLYLKLGFKQVGMVHTQVEGDDAFLDFPAMVRET